MTDDPSYAKATDDETMTNNQLLMTSYTQNNELSP